MKAFLGNVNIEPLAAFFPGEKIYFGGYNQYLSLLMDKESQLFALEAEELFLFIDAEELLKGLRPDALGLPPLAEARREWKFVLGALGRYRKARPKTAIVVANLFLPPGSPGGHLDANAGAGKLQLEAALDRDLREFCRRGDNLLVLDWRQIVLGAGHDNLYEPKYWYLGRIKLNNSAFELLAGQYRSLLNAYRGKAHKVLVVDLDNTLWGGVLGEDGPEGIALSEEGAGKAFRDFQASIKALQRTGALLAICSKNNQDEVERLFRSHPMMVLRWEDFVARRVNWRNKAENLRSIAAELGLGLDSLVFLDDSPTERALVRERLAQVAVPEFPADPAALKGWFGAAVVREHFPRLRLTSEDARKTEQYRARSKRVALAAKMELDDFIESLNIKLRVSVNERRQLQRLAQLTQKTNQFNLTGRRYTAGELEALLAEPSGMLLGLEYEDKFGPEGLVGAAVLRLDKGIARMEVFLLSCRVIGRKIEYLFLREALAAARARGAKACRLEFVQTGRNEAARGFHKQIAVGNSGRVLALGRLLAKLKPELVKAKVVRA